MKNYIINRLIILFVIVVLPNLAMSQTTIWSEDWSTAKNGAYPETVNKMYYAGKYTSCVKANGATYAGAKLPELMLVQGDYFSVTLTDLKGCYGDLELVYKSNRSTEDSPRMEVTANGTAIDIVSEGKSHKGTVHVDEGTEKLVLVFTAYGGNARIDDLSLVYNGISKQVSTLSFGEKIDNHTFVVYKGQEESFSSQKATLSNSDIDGTVSYQTSDDNVVTVNAQGGVSFVGLGEAMVTAFYPGTDEVTASRASYTIKYIESQILTQIVFSSSANSFANAPEKKDSNITNVGFASKDGKSYKFQLKNANRLKETGTNKFFLYCISRNTGGWISSPSFGFPNGYDVTVVYGQSSPEKTDSDHVLNLYSESGGTSIGGPFGKDDAKNGTGASATLSVPVDEPFEILPGNAATISNITITPHAIGKIETMLSFPNDVYSVTVSNIGTFDAPQAKLTTKDGDGVDTEEEIVYSIADNSLVAIDSSTGKLTLVGDIKEGDEVKISANYPGDDVYEASSSSYTLKVVSDDKILITFDEVTDISDQIAQYNGEQVNVLLKRSISKDYLNTICLPFAMDEDLIAETFGIGSAVSCYEGMSDGKLIFYSVKMMEAGVPYIVKATETKDEMTLKNVMIETETPVVVKKTKGDKSYSFCGAFDPYTFAVDDGSLLFLATDGQLKIPTANGRMKGMRAYFDVDQTDEVEPNSVNLLIDGLSTAINTPEVAGDPPVVNGYIYNLKGERLNVSDGQSLPKGVYIKGNKKILIK